MLMSILQGSSPTFCQALRSRFVFGCVFLAQAEATCTLVLRCLFGQRTVPSSLPFIIALITAKTTLPAKHAARNDSLHEVRPGLPMLERGQTYRCLLSSYIKKAVKAPPGSCR